MSKFTKGKWEVVNAGEKNFKTQLFYGYHVFSAAKPIAKIFEALDDNGNNTQANARLIAAAPEMYELLKRFAECRHEGDMFDIMQNAHELVARIDGKETI